MKVGCKKHELMALERCVWCELVSLTEQVEILKAELAFLKFQFKMNRELVMR